MIRDHKQGKVILKKWEITTVLNTLDKEIEKLFSHTEEELFTSFTLDSKGNKIGFYKDEKGQTYLLRKNLRDAIRAVKYLETGSKVIFINTHNGKAATKHKFLNDNSEIIYRYDSDFKIKEILSFNADASIFRTSLTPFGELTEIYNSSSKKSKTFYVKSKQEVALINIDDEGNLVQKGTKTLLKYLRRKFAKELINTK